MAYKNSKIRVVIVDDSPFMRKIIGDILNSDKDIEVISTAKNGKEGIEIIKQLKPDVVTMDIEMPIMNGLETLKNIMKINPVPVIMLSNLTSKGAEATMLALELGAVDFIQKPSSLFSINTEDFKTQFIKQIKSAHRAKLIKSYTIPEEKTTIPDYKKDDIITTTSETKNIVAIGTSTGGPRALQHIIPLIPKRFPGSIFVVQHMPPGFTKSLADRLDSLSQIRVKEAEHGEKVYSGYVYIAPGNYHLKIKQNRSDELYIDLSQEAPVTGHRPSVDVLFDSLSKLNLVNIKTTAVIMTGMGSDGTKGLKNLKKKKQWHIIAQNEESSVVYGMPKSAVQAGVVDEILPLDKIVKAIVNRMGVI